MLKTVYADAYNDNIAGIEGSAHLRAWGEQVLVALVLKLIADKLIELMGCSLSGNLAATGGDLLANSLKHLRDMVAAQATGDRTAFANAAIALWSRMISLFRTGHLPTRSNAYEPISAGPVAQIDHDANARAASFGELAIALALFSDGQTSGLWDLSGPANDDLASGALTSTPTWGGAQPRTIFFVRSAATALDLNKRGAFANDNTIVIHSDDAWHQLQPSGTVTARTPKRPPGRTGIPTTLHVSIAHLLHTEPDFGSLRKRFAEEVTL